MKIQFNFSTVIFGLVVLFMLWVFVDKCKCSCGNRVNNNSDILSKKTIHDTIPVHDTIPKYIPTPVAYIPNGYVKASDIKPPIPEKQFIDKTDTNYLKYLEKIRDDYFATLYYDTTYKFQYGKARISDSLRQNRIISREAIFDFNIPHDKEIITLTQPKRNVLYFTLSGQYLQYDGTMGIGAGLMFKLRNDKAIELSYLLNSHNQQAFQLSTKIPIKLRK